MSVDLQLTDEEARWVARAQRGDLDAFNQIVLKYQALAYNVAYRTLQDGDSAADAVQDSFLKAFRAISAFQGGSLKSWIMRILVNTCYDVLRARNRHPTDSIDDLPMEPDYAGHLTDRSERPDEAAERVELAQLIERAIATLPVDQRLVLTLCDVHGYAYDEIAALTSMPMGTVKSRINRARTKVREYLLRFPEQLPPAFRQ